ncbi:type II 3-dehydroquinate dehydratase [candidate division KSB1 bacterium]|nr:type II 3-dehydroquinate dehydratase [candidate division KSB1 bacterium]MCH8284900.1 type II 3-dehydroquinate dehydratase [candidate division KSB1 bacterium]
MKNILVVHGPNLNLLGEREPELYGSETLDEINKNIADHANKHGIECRFFQSNHEGAIIDTIQDNRKWMDGLIINPGAYTHSSAAIRDTLLILSCPIIEVHLSNIHSREKFRRHSYISPVATGVICGLGAKGYILAVDALAL